MVTLPEGRILGYREFGDPAGVPVIALHGTPGSRLKFADCNEVAARLGLRLISVDRWGYGLTSLPPPGATLAGFGADMVVLADALGIGRCLVTGVSGGGPFAVAAAAALGARVIATGLVSPIGVIDRETKLSAFHGACFRVMPYFPGTIGALFQLYRIGLHIAPNAAMRLALSLAPKVDQQAIADDGIRKRLIATFAGGLAGGVKGPVCDLALFVAPWNFDPGAITAPLRIWIGSADRNVPQDGVRRLAAALSTSELVTLPGEGHLWIARHGDDVMSWLAGQATGIRSK